MNSQEAINALFEGKKIKRLRWKEDYIYMTKGQPTYFQQMSRWFTAHEILFTHDDWEIYEEPIEEYQWLCQDIGSGEFFISCYVVGDMDHGMGCNKYKIIKRLEETKRIRKV